MAFCFTAREIAKISRCSFCPKANPTRQLTGLRPKPEQQPKQQRLRPKQRPKPKQQQPVPKRQLRR
ncbi:MAG: hypothetical protein PPHEINF_0310 [uncultured Paraburkholderia sp.]|nr:MAG: hypothetical protein PPHEINF_0310 [uncultured Paraburkholderia sp.]CAH2910228.1 MAG: hypothetical protein PPHEMADMSA_0482 [uncultured Paraburkholderia sp.]